jgi:hypothetical protein
MLANLEELVTKTTHTDGSSHFAPPGWVDGLLPIHQRNNEFCDLPRSTVIYSPVFAPRKVLCSLTTGDPVTPQ